MIIQNLELNKLDRIKLFNKTIRSHKKTEI